MNMRIIKAIIIIIVVLILIGQASAAHTLDTNGTYQTTAWSTANPGNLSYTAGSGATLMVLHIQTDVALRTYGIPTFHNKDFTNVGMNFSGYEGASELWYLLLDATDTGTAYNVSVPNAATSQEMTFQVSTYKSATGSSVFDKNTSEIGSSANPTQALTSAANGSVYVNSIFIGSDIGGTVTSPGILLYMNDDGTQVGGSQYYLQATAGAQAIGWTVLYDDWSMQTAVFGEGAAAGTQPNITSWGNNYTDNNTLSFTAPQGTAVRFNLTANQSVNWTSPNSTYLDGNGTINGNFTKMFNVVGTNFINITCSNVNGSCSNWMNWTITVTKSTSDIMIPANSWGMFNNWSLNTNFSSISANESNDVAFTFYNVTTGEWESYYPGYSWNAGQNIDKNNSVMGFFNTQTTITANTITPWNTSITEGWNMLYLMGTSNQTLTAICNDMVNCTDIYYYNSTSNDYVNTSTDTIQPNQGFLAYMNQTGTWIRSNI